MYKSETNIAPYIRVTILVFIVFFLQTLSPSNLVILFLMGYFVIFYTITELIKKQPGIYATILIILLQILYPIFVPTSDSLYFYLIAIFHLFLTFYYFLVKNLRKRKFKIAFEREKHFRSLVNYGLQPIILKNEKGEIIFASESINEILGLKGKLKSGVRLSEFMHPKDAARHESFLKEVLNDPYQRKSVELRMKRGEGNDRIWVRNDSINLLQQKDIKAIVSTIQDITFQKELDREKVDIIKQEKKARALAEDAVRDRDEFLSIASHELKTPLTTVLLQLQATLRKISTQSLADFSGTELLNSLQIAEKQSKSLATLIKDLLNVSLASTGRLTLNKEKVNLAKLTQSLVKRYEQEIKLSGSEVSTLIKNKEVSGNWDPVRIEQGISNLLINALKYSGGSKVTISVKKNQNWAYLSVKDQGKGIPEKHQKKIFEPFKRLNNNKNTKGLGIGLFIVKQIAVAHKGDVSVKSSPKKGSTFTLKLPLS